MEILRRHIGGGFSFISTLYTFEHFSTLGANSLTKLISYCIILTKFSLLSVWGFCPVGKSERQAKYRSSYGY